MVDLVKQIELELKILERCRMCIHNNEPYDLKAVRKEIKRSKKMISSLILQITPIKSSMNSNTADIHHKIIQLELLCDGANKVHRSLILDKKNAKALKVVERTILELNEKLELLKRHAKLEIEDYSPASIRSVKTHQCQMNPISGELHVRVTGLFGLPKDTPHKNGRWASEYFHTKKTSIFGRYRNMGRKNAPDDFIISIHVGGSNVATVAWNEKKTMYGGDEKVINLRKCTQLEFEVYYTDSRSLCAFGVMPLSMLGNNSLEESLALTNHKKIELFPGGVLHCQTLFKNPDECQRKREEDSCRLFAHPISLRRNESILSRRAQFRNYCTSIPRQKIETLEHYDMKKLIGIGAFGEVHLAIRKLDHMYCAVKTVKPSEQLEMNELKVLKDLNHPFICKLISHFKDGGNIHFVMEFCEAGDLHSHLSETIDGFSMNIIEYFAASIVLAVEYLHERLYVHRDLKTENMMLTRTGQLKLIDFGLCKKLKSRNETMTEIVGTTTHLSAEIHRREEYGIDMDWYAVGVSLYQLRTRSLPFYDFHELEMTKNSRIDKCYVFKDLLIQLTTQYRQARLGYFDSNDVRKHAFFTDINFDDVYSMKMKPPYLPKLNPGPGVDLRYFPEEFCEVAAGSSSSCSSSVSNASSISHL